MIGKFSERSIKSSVSFLDNEQDLQKLLLNPEQEITNLEMIDESIMKVTHKTKTAYAPVSTRTNFVINAFVTRY